MSVAIVQPAAEVQSIVTTFTTLIATMGLSVLVPKR